MPLSDRTVTPLRLGRRKISEEEQHEDIVLDAVCQNVVLGAIVQLASLVRHADDIFCDLAEECQNVFDKVESIGGKIQNIQRIIEHLDSTDVKIRKYSNLELI
ncbi:serine-rich adhesin for platelets [Biomphalaria pfeifferi]|uniref:Serine-rich adhesin for platelets n=1 Tax=Biomphalaria pfeifferi TaxID=112525 RepID=A0AAD8B1D6_BIOPF|nr:serine-rich adhesin for platelets [Biomphalaria pfeifferi]